MIEDDLDTQNIKELVVRLGAEALEDGVCVTPLSDAIDDIRSFVTQSPFHELR